MIGNVSLSDSPPLSGPLNPYRKYSRRTAKLLAAATSGFNKSAGKTSIDIRLFVYIRLAKLHHLSSLWRNDFFLSEVLNTVENT